jgi:hypothetical protein
VISMIRFMAIPRPFLKLADDGLRVDHAQHLAIFKGVLPIHENVEAMVLGILQDAKKNNIDVAKRQRWMRLKNDSIAASLI